MFEDYYRILFYIGQNQINFDFAIWLGKYLNFSYIDNPDIFEINSSKNDKIIINGEIENYNYFIRDFNYKFICVSKEINKSLLRNYDIVIVIDLTIKPNPFYITKDRYLFDLKKLHNFKKIFDRKLKIETIYEY